MSAADPPANLWPPIEADSLDRLAFWQHKRARDEEIQKVAALCKEPHQRTAQDEVVLAYSPMGTASKGCGCG